MSEDIGARVLETHRRTRELVPRVCVTTNRRDFIFRRIVAGDDVLDALIGGLAWSMLGAPETRCDGSGRLERLEANGTPMTVLEAGAPEPGTDVWCGPEMGRGAAHALADSPV